MTTATKQGHTPGPWHRNIRRKGRYPVVFAGRNQHVATASQQGDPAETEANIDLISAAPELLEALLELTRHVEDCRKSWEADGAERDTKAHGLAVCLNNRAGDMIAAAIARATGQGEGRP